MNALDWNAALLSMRDALSPAQFQNWVKPIEYIASDERSVRLGVPSRFHEDMLRSRFAEALRTAIKRQTGNELQLEFEIQVREENTEASHSLDVNSQLLSSPTAEAEASAATTARPSLRLISNEVESTDSQPSHSRESSLNLPQFNTPFLTSGFNQLAYQCAMLFAEGTQAQLNPLIIKAGVGLGKTHLLSEIGKAIHNRNPSLRIRYINFESFTSEMVQSFNNKTASQFQYKYRWETDILLFDEVSGLAGRKRSQEELLHIFNEIIGRGGRVAFTTSKPIHQLTEFIDTLKSRLSSGVNVEISNPSFDEKVELLGQVGFHNQLSVDPTVLRTLADRANNDIRALISELLQLHLQSQLQNKPLNNDFLAQAGWAKEAPKDAITLEEIIGLVEHNFGTTRADLVSKSRKQSILWARQVAMYLARRYTLLALEEIGRTFGRDHSTVIHAFDKVKETIEGQPNLGYQVEFLMKKLEARNPKDNYELPI